MTSFAAIGNTVGLADAIILFLKRNFVSVFLPAGGISSLVFFTDPLKKKGIKETQILFASTIYAFVGFLSVAVVGIPAFMFALVKNAPVLVGSAGWGTDLALAAKQRETPSARYGSRFTERHHGTRTPGYGSRSGERLRCVSEND